MKTANKIRIMAFAGVIIAMNIVLARLVAINIGPTLRITVSQTPVYLAGFWFGPVVGGICGFLGDLIGSLLQGYAPNPFPACNGEEAGVMESFGSFSYPWCSRSSWIYLYRPSYLLWNTLVSTLCHSHCTDHHAHSSKLGFSILFIQKSSDRICKKKYGRRKRQNTSDQYCG